MILWLSTEKKKKEFKFKMRSVQISVVMDTIVLQYYISLF